MKLLSLVFLTFFYINVQAQSLNKIVEGDIFTGIRYDKNYVVNPEGEKSHTVGVSSTMSTTSRTALTANVISGQYTYELTAGAASQTFTVSSTALPAGLNGQTCEGSFSYRYASLTIPFVASVLSGTTEIASGTLTNSTGSTSATVRHTLTYPCVEGLKPSVRITSTASSAIKLYPDKYFTGAYLNLTASGTSGSGGTSLPTGELITSGTAEFGNPFVGFTTAATEKPTTSGTLGAASLTAVVSSTAPLDGANSFIISKASGNVQGQQVRIPFSVPLAGFARAHTITIDYKNLTGLFEAGYVSGTTVVSSSLIPYILDHSTNTYTEPSTYLFSASSTTIADNFQATFQTSASGTSYSLVLHQASSATAPYSIQVDNISVNPNKYVFGTPITDWATYTNSCNGSFTTNTTYICRSRRVGDTKEYEIVVNLAGAPNATTLTVNIPDSIDLNKFSSLGSFYIGLVDASDNGTHYQGSVSVQNATSVQPVIYLTNSTYANAAGVTQAQPFTFGAGDSVVLRFYVPISGQASSVQMSDQGSTRVVSFRAEASNQTPKALNVNTAFSISTVEDTHGAGGPTSYVIPSAGYYSLLWSAVGNSVAAGGANQLWQAQIFKNGAALFTGYFRSQAAVTLNEFTTIAAGTAFLKAGDVITVNTNTNFTTPGTATGGSLSISKVAGPNQTATNDVVAASYYLSANQALTANVTPVNFDTKEYDTHNAVKAGVNWAFTAPFSGFYSVLGTAEPNVSLSYLIYKNGIQYKAAGAATAGLAGPIISSLQMAAGDILDVRVNANSTIRGGALNAVGTAYIIIKREGN